MIGKLNYKHFEKITQKFGIVYEGWPLERFRCPGDINSVPELNVLRNAFVSGAAFFRRLSDDELEQWRRQQAHSHQLVVAIVAETTPTQGPPHVTHLTAAELSEPSVDAPGPTASLAASNDGTSRVGTSPVPLASSTQPNTPASPPQVAFVTGTQQAASGNKNQVVFTVNEGTLIQHKPHANKGKKRGPYKHWRDADAIA